MGTRAGRIPQARGLLVRCGPGSSVTEPGSVLLDRVQLERAFTALGERLVRRGVVADGFVVGGASPARGRRRLNDCRPGAVLTTFAAMRGPENAGRAVL